MFDRFTHRLFDALGWMPPVRSRKVAEAHAQAYAALTLPAMT